jgi:8-oxo-dGTP pyrophosphatase MutT (NUDIX family)
MGEAGEPRAREDEQAASDGGKGGGKGGAKRRRRRRQASGRRSQTAASGGERAATDPATSSRRKGAGKRKAPARAKGTEAAKRARTRRRRPKAPTAPTKREVSAGGVVYRRADDGIEIVLASRRTRRGELAWGLAKGGIEGDESLEDAAVREVREETGLLAEIEASLGETRYFYVWEDVRIRKTVHFFLMRYTGGDIDDRDDEMEEIRWFPLERALKRAAYRGERDVLGRAAELLR